MEMTQELQELIGKALNHRVNSEFVGSKWDALRILAYGVSSDPDREYDTFDFLGFKENTSVVNLLHGAMRDALEDGKPQDFIDLSKMHSDIDYHWYQDAFLELILLYHQDTTALVHMLDNGFTLQESSMPYFKNIQDNERSENYALLKPLVMQFKLDQSLEEKPLIKKIKL